MKPIDKHTEWVIIHVVFILKQPTGNSRLTTLCDMTNLLWTSKYIPLSAWLVVCVSTIRSTLHLNCKNYTQQAAQNCP